VFMRQAKPMRVSGLSWKRLPDLRPASRRASAAHWSKGTPLAPHRGLDYDDRHSKEIQMSGRTNHAEPPPVLDALDKSKQATETVRQAADDLAVVNTVLDTQVPAEVRNEEVDQALAHADQLQEQLDKSVDLLQDVTKTLEAEVKNRST